MPPVKARRAYRSPLRKESTLRAQRAVITAAARLFIEQGYARTTVDQIATRAGVSRPTVFAVGTKPRLLALARLDAVAGERSLGNESAFQEILATPDPFDLLRRFAGFTAEIARRLGPIQLVLEQAASTDSEIKAILNDSQQELYGCARSVVAALRAAGALRDGILEPRATDMLWLLIQPSQYQRLVADRRWSHRAFEQWQAATMLAMITCGSTT